MCSVIVACNLGVIEALYQMNRRSETRRLTRYPSASNAMEARPSLLAINGCPSNGTTVNAAKNGRPAQQQASVDADDASSYVSGSFHRHHLSVRKRDSSASSSHRLRHQPSMQTQEEIKFARLMAVLCIFYVLCWIPQLVRRAHLSIPPHSQSLPGGSFVSASIYGADREPAGECFILRAGRNPRNSPVHSMTESLR